ncbi:hypothetical protein [Burkholderia sp. LMG 13014]|uniref:hypothetical protein n=1 Tax=Burkholderia sp. LMG 13014 TaxID=2709306 RepID=UPI001963A7F9|nr:hypothetical protein [Burkholderia sp. LMG 13014]
MSEQQDNQPTGVVGTVINELHQFEQKVEDLIHPGADAAPSSTEPQAVAVTVENKDSLSTAPLATEPAIDPNAGAPIGSLAPVEREAGEAATGEFVAGARAPATGTSTDVSRSSASIATLNGASEGVNFLNPADAPAVAESGEIGAAPAVAAPGAISATTSVDVAASDVTLDDGDAGNGTGGASAATATLTPNVAASGDAGIGVDEVGNVLDAGIADLSAAPAAVSAAADALLARWHREMSLLGRGLSAETEKLIRDTAAYLGL